MSKFPFSPKLLKIIPPLPQGGGLILNINTPDNKLKKILWGKVYTVVDIIYLKDRLLGL